LPTGSWKYGKQRGENKQAPHAVNDTGIAASSSIAIPADVSASQAPAPSGTGRYQTHRNGDQQRDKRGHQRAVNRNQRTKDLVRRIPLFGPQEGKPNFWMLGQEEKIRDTIMPPSSNSTISAASFTSALKIMSPFYPEG
jgi:hypothetical protein